MGLDIQAILAKLRQWDNEIPSPVTGRDPNASSLGAIGRAADSAGFGTDRRRSRLATGFASQWYGLDDNGNPALGARPGIIDETLSLATLPSMLVKPLMDKVASGLGVDPSDPYYQMMGKAGLIPLYEPPQFAADASERADKLHSAIREDMGLTDPHGFAENAQESLGTMLAQLPIPGGGSKKTAEGLTQAAVESPLEWFTPTVRPSAENYLTGAGFGGAMGAAADALGDDEELPLVLPSDQPGLYDVRPAYEDGTVGYSGHPDDQAELARALAAQHPHHPHRSNFAKGGKVSAADRLVEKWLREAGEGWSAEFGHRNTSQYLDAIRRHMPPESVPTRPEEVDALRAYVHEPWGTYQAGDRHNISNTVKRLAFNIPPEVPLHRGVPNVDLEGESLDLSSLPGFEAELTKLPFIPTSQRRDTAVEFATTGNMRNETPGGPGHVFSLHRQGPVKAFPIPFAKESEWVLPEPSRSVVRGTGPERRRGGETYVDIDVDYTQLPTRKADGGRVGALQDLIDKYMKKNGDGLYTGNNRKYLEHVRKHLRTVPQEPEHLEILEDYAEAPWGWSPSEEHALSQIVNEHAVPLPPDLPLYRGVSGWNGIKDNNFEIDWEGGLGEEVNTSTLPVLPVTNNEGMARDFATMLGDHPTNARLRLHRKAPVRGFPLMQSGQDEWLLTRPDMMTIRGARPYNEDHDLFDVDVDYTQLPTRKADGGHVDECNGGLATIQAMKSKYAGGGKVDALSAIKQAIAHLDSGNTAAALQTLQSSPAALRDPGISSAMARLRNPLASRDARRQVLNSAADAHAAPPMLAKGGKVSALYMVSLGNKGKSPKNLAHARKIGQRLGVEVDHAEDEAAGLYNVRLGRHEKKFLKDQFLEVRNKDGDELDADSP